MRNLRDILPKRDDSGFADIETPEELLPAAAPASEPVLPALDRERAQREPLVSRRARIVAASVLGALVVLVVAWCLVVAAARTTVPAVTRVSQKVAETRLHKAGLSAKVIERRFSDQASGQVLEQRPVAGTVLSRGDTVELIVSAGTEDFAMPDVVGIQVDAAKKSLEERGLVVQVEAMTSTQPSGTVLGTVPAAGATVRSGDSIRLQVASQSASGISLQPYVLQGLSFIIDPSPVPSGAVDVPLDVARRLRALLEASGASVIVLRSANDTATSDADRARQALETSSSAAVGLVVNAQGPGGRGLIVAPASSAASATGTASPLATAIGSQLASAAAPTTQTVAAADAVFAPLTTPWTRVILGSFADRTDVASFNDPGWADGVARAIYAGIGEAYGTKGE